MNCEMLEIPVTRPDVFDEISATRDFCANLRVSVQLFVVSNEVIKNVIKRHCRRVSPKSPTELWNQRWVQFSKAISSQRNEECFFRILRADSLVRARLNSSENENDGSTNDSFSSERVRALKVFHLRAP